MANHNVSSARPAPGATRQASTALTNATDARPGTLALKARTESQLAFMSPWKGRAKSWRINCRFLRRLPAGISAIRAGEDQLRTTETGRGGPRGGATSVRFLMDPSSLLRVALAMMAISARAQDSCRDAKPFLACPAGWIGHKPPNQTCTACAPGQSSVDGSTLQ